MKSNWIYIFYSTFSIDILFLFVVNNLFLINVKGISEFDTILITLLGLAFALVLYPLVSILLKRISNHASIIICSCGLIISMILYTFCTTLYGFIIAEILYCTCKYFKLPVSTMLKKNLLEQGKSDEFVKWKSLGMLGYSIVTAIAASVSGIFFNISPYLPMFLGLAFSVLGLVFSILYKEPKLEEDKNKVKEAKKVKVKVNYKKLIFNKLMILVLLMNLITVGTYIFYQTKATLLIQALCAGHFDLATTSLIVSGCVLASRIMRVISNFVAPIMYKKAKKKSTLILGLSFAIVVAGICFAVGCIHGINITFSLVLVTIGFLIAIGVRDIYSSLESKMIIDHFDGEEERQALVISNMYGNFGRLLLNGFTLLVLGFTSINVVFIALIVFAIGQVFICIPLSKFLQVNYQSEIEKANEEEIFEGGDSQSAEKHQSSQIKNAKNKPKNKITKVKLKNTKEIKNLNKNYKKITQ